MSTIITFSIAFVICSLIYFPRRRAINHGHPASTGVLARFDISSLKIINFLRYRVWQIIQTVRFIFIFKIKYAVLALLVKARGKVGESVEKQRQKIIGHTILSPTGSTSFYLKNIGQGKTKGRKGMIQDSLIEREAGEKNYDL